MSAGAATAAAGTAVAAGIAAIKASGVIVILEPEEFVSLVQRQPAALVVHAAGGFFNAEHRYLTSYKGLAFYTKGGAPLDLPPGAEIVQAKRMSVPGG